MNGTVSMAKIPPKSKLKITVGENMKTYIKNVTGAKEGKYKEPQTLAYKEDGKKIELKAQEAKETKLAKRLSHRLVLVKEDEIKKKKEVK